MNDLLQRTLSEMAASAPVARVSDNTWRRGRRRRFRRRLVGAALVLLVVASAGLVTQVMVGADRFAAGDRITLPARIARGWPVLSTVDESPNGPVIAAFESSVTFRFGLTVSNGLTVVGRDGSYRFLPTVDDPTNRWLLSPDGRYIARRGELVDLTNARREAIPELLRVLAWDRTGERLLYADGSDVYVRDVAANSHRKLFARPGFQDIDAAALSPDGSRLAVHQDGTLVTFDTATGAILWHGNSSSGVLAGPAAWTPDGRSVVMLHNHQRGWRLGYVDASGETTYEPSDRPGAPRGVAGWRGDDPLVVTNSALLRAPFNGAAETLMLLENGTAQVPQQVIEQARFGGPAIRPGPGDIQRSYYAAAAAVLLWLGLSLLYLFGPVRRKRSRSRAA